MTDFIYQPTAKIRLGDYLISHFQQEQWTHFRAAVAFIKRSGTHHIREALAGFSMRAKVQISAGIDLEGTSKEGLQDLLEAVGSRGEIWIYHNENNSTFHPKVYLFKNESFADVVVGSGNLTEGGLFTNYEASLAISLDLALDVNRELLKQVEDTLDEWSNQATKTSVLLTSDILNQLVENEYVPSETQAIEIEEAPAHFRRTAERAQKSSLFARVLVPRAPTIKETEETYKEEDDLTDEDFEVEVPVPVPAQAGNFAGFLMILQRTDVGRGQTTAGTNRRSPEVFIPLVARNYDTDFWGWPSSFVPDESNPGKMDRKGVKMRIGTSTVEVNMMTWPKKHDFRLRNEALRSAGNVGDILRVERANGEDGYAYYIEVIPQGTVLYSKFLALCTQPTPGSKRMWGYYSKVDLDGRMIGLPQMP